MHVAAHLLAARAVPRAVKLAGLVAGALFGLTGGLATASLVVASDAQSAYDRVSRATDGFDVAIARERSPETLATDLLDVKGVAETATLTTFAVAAVTAEREPRGLGPQPDDPCYTGAGEITATAHNQGWRGHTPPMLLTEGRLPRADALEVVVPEITASRSGLDVGDRIRFVGDCTHEGGKFDQPIDMTISGLGTGALDGPEVGANFALENLLISPRAVNELNQAGAEPSSFAMAWLADGVTPGDLGDLPEGASIVLDLVESRAAVHRDLQPDATSLRVFALIVALTALVILGPLVGRLARAGNVSVPTLQALGMSQRSLLGVGLVRGAAVALVATVTSAATAVGAAPLIPKGVARHFEGVVTFSPGLLQTGIGAFIAATVVVAITLLATGLSLRRRPSDVRRRTRTLGSWAASRIPYPEWAAGVRFGLQPGALDDPTPVRSGLTTAAIAVATVLGVITFSSSLDHLRHTPRLYGVNWDAFALVEDAETIAQRLEADPEVEAVSLGTFFPPQQATLGDKGAEVWLMSFQGGHERVKPTVITGRAPENEAEVMLSRDLSDDTRTAIGDSIPLHVPAVESQLARRLGQAWDGPPTRTTILRVVGIGVLPLGDGRVGIGASMTFDGLRSALGPTSSPALLRLVETASPAALTRVVREELSPDATPADVAAMPPEDLIKQLVPTFDAHLLVVNAHGPKRAIKKVIAASAGALSPEAFSMDPTPERIINLDLSQASRIPVAFGGLMAVIAAAVITVLLATGGRLRRRELAILRAIGFTPRHVRRALAAQAITTVVAASVLAPVGIVAGRSAWVSYSAGLGVAPVARVSAWEIAACITALLVVALFVGALVAQVHTRGRLVALLQPAE